MTQIDSLLLILKKSSLLLKDTGVIAGSFLPCDNMVKHLLLRKNLLVLEKQLLEATDIGAGLRKIRPLLFSNGIKRSILLEEKILENILDAGGTITNRALFNRFKQYNKRTLYRHIHVMLENNLIGKCIDGHTIFYRVQ